MARCVLGELVFWRASMSAVNFWPGSQGVVFVSNLIKKALAVLALSVAGQASAYTITLSGATVDVGSEDSFVAETKDLNGAAAGKPTDPDSELAWVNTFLNPDTTTLGQSLSVAYQALDNGDPTKQLYAFDLTGTPDYFVIENNANWALFKNTSDLGWAVFDLSQLNEDAGWQLGAFGTLTISHVTEFGASTPTAPGTSDVPEPASLALLSLGLIGVAFIRRRHL